MHTTRHATPYRKKGALESSYSCTSHENITTQPTCKSDLTRDGGGIWKVTTPNKNGFSRQHYGTRCAVPAKYGTVQIDILRCCYCSVPRRSVSRRRGTVRSRTTAVSIVSKSNHCGLRTNKLETSVHPATVVNRIDYKHHTPRMNTLNCRVRPRGPSSKSHVPRFHVVLVPGHSSTSHTHPSTMQYIMVYMECYGYFKVYLHDTICVHHDEV